MKLIGNTFHKCIHEALDLDYCDCSDEVREELEVKLPKLEDLPPCEHVWTIQSPPFGKKKLITFCLMCGEKG